MVYTVIAMAAVVCIAIAAAVAVSIVPIRTVIAQVAAFD